MLFCIANFVLFRIFRLAEAYSEPSRTSTMEPFAEIVKDFQLLTIFIKGSILDIQMGCEYASEQRAFLSILLLKIYLVCATAFVAKFFFPVYLAIIHTYQLTIIYSYQPIANF